MYFRFIQLISLRYHKLVTNKSLERMRKYEKECQIILASYTVMRLSDFWWKCRLFFFSLFCRRLSSFPRRLSTVEHTNVGFVHNALQSRWQICLRDILSTRWHFCIFHLSVKIEWDLLEGPHLGSQFKLHIHPTPTHKPSIALSLCIYYGLPIYPRNSVSSQSQFRIFGGSKYFNCFEACKSGRFQVENWIFGVILQRGFLRKI